MGPEIKKQHIALPAALAAALLLFLAVGGGFFARYETVEMANTVELSMHINEQEIDRDFWREHRIARLLAVDDEEVSCENIRMAMEDTGVRVDCTLDGSRAVEELKRAAEAGTPYDVVLLDRKMPEMDGVETARRIRRGISEDIPIVVLSSYDWPEVEEARAARDVFCFAALSRRPPATRQQRPPPPRAGTAPDQSRNKREDPPR